jgi:hypothetical protein
MCRVEDVMMLVGRLEASLFQFVDLVGLTPLDDIASHAAFAHHIRRIRTSYFNLLGQTALDELDLRVGLLDAADWANDMMAKLLMA